MASSDYKEVFAKQHTLLTDIAILAHISGHYCIKSPLGADYCEHCPCYTPIPNSKSGDCGFSRIQKFAKLLLANVENADAIYEAFELNKPDNVSNAMTHALKNIGVEPQI